MSNKELLPARDEIPTNHKWDLSPLFRVDKEWETLYMELEEKLVNITDYKGRLSESIEIFKEALDFNINLSQQLERLYTYAHLKSDEDKTNQRYLGFYQRVMNLNTRISELSSFLNTEIQSISNKIIKRFLQDERLKEYRFFIEKLLRFKPHTLKEEIEEVLAINEELTHAPSAFFSQLDNADLKFGTMGDEQGNIIELTHGNFSTFLISPERDIRKKAFFQYYNVYEDHKYSISTALAYSIKKDFIYSKIKKFKSCRTRALFPDKIPMDVYDNLIDTIKDNLSPLFKYLKFRKEYLGLNELHFYDTYVPLVSDIKFNMPYKDAVNVCVKALSLMGEEYTDVLQNGLSTGWVDRYENKGKRSGAYSSGCYDSPPYILMNYEENNINSLYTLIHEAGHSMHSYYSCKNQPYLYHDYTIFVAEVASTFNEVLLSKHLLEHYRDDKKMVAYILNREIDNIRATLYRQTMFAEFEKKTHEIVERNEPLTLDTITDIYKDLLKTYFGDTLVIDEPLTIECLRIPHFYSSFYVYKYATGISAAIALAEKILKEGDTGRDGYLNFLKMGGSKYPIDELIETGIDMSKPEPVKNAIIYFENQINKFINTL